MLSPKYHPFGCWAHLCPLAVPLELAEVCCVLYRAALRDFPQRLLSTPRVSTWSPAGKNFGQLDLVSYLYLRKRQRKVFSFLYSNEGRVQVDNSYVPLLSLKLL